MRSFSVLLGVAATTAALAFAGCGGTVIDATSMEETVDDYLVKQLNEDVKSVSCPSDQPVDPGLEIDCDVTLKGGEEKIATVEITNEKADFRIKHYEGSNE
jgi:uncharacterized protein DUF4333